MGYYNVVATKKNSCVGGFGRVMLAGRRCGQLGCIEGAKRLCLGKGDIGCTLCECGLVAGNRGRGLCRVSSGNGQCLV